MLKRLTKTPVTRRRERGLQLVETAIVMPAMILLLGSVAEFGRYFHMRSTMLRATMTGAVYMSDKPNTSTDQLAASRMAACGQPTACTAAELLYPGVTDANLKVYVVGNNLGGSVASPVGGPAVVGTTVIVATDNVRYAPVFSLSKMTKAQNDPNRNSWTNIPINVQTRMRYAGS